jgi:hypothetical protein
MRQFVNRATQLLHYRDRWRHIPYSLLLAGCGLAGFFAGVLVHSDLLVAGAFLCFFGAVILALRLSPAQWESQLVQTEADAQKLQRDYASQCQSAATDFVKERRAALQSATTAAVQEGDSLVQIHCDLKSLEESLQGLSNSLLEDLSKQQTVLGQRREEFQRQRARLAAVSKNWRAYYFPSLGRGCAREALETLFKMNEAANEQVRLQAAIGAMQNLAESAGALGYRYAGTLNSANDTADAQPVNEGLPYWLGVPLPPADMVQKDAISSVEGNLARIRGAVLDATADDQTATDGFDKILEKIFSDAQPWPTTIENYLARLNGETSFFADRLVKASAEWVPSNPIPGRDRYRKLFVLAAKGPNSAVCKALRERLPDAVSVVGIEHLDEEVLAVSEERNVVLSELPEAQACLRAFRALPREQQAMLVTAADASDVIDYYPDLSEDQGNPARTLASAVALGIVSRSGSQEYAFGEEVFAKGYRQALETLRLDKRLATRVQARVAEAVAREGSATIVAKLAEAQDHPACLVPKDVVREFKASLQEAVALLNRRANQAPATA